MLAGISIVAAMWRPDRLHYLFLHGRISLPIVWDIIVIMTYISAGLILLFLVGDGLWIVRYEWKPEQGN